MSAVSGQRSGESLSSATLSSVERTRVLVSSSVRDLGTNRYFLWAQSIAKLAE